MKKVIVTCTGILSIVALYATYMLCTPEPADGAVLASIVGAVTGLVGYMYGLQRGKA